MKLVEFLNEAIRKAHFNDRVQDRLLNPEFTNFPEESPEIKNEVLNYIQFLEKVQFPSQDNIAILLYKGHKWYQYTKQSPDKTEHTEGNAIWVIIRGNDLETIIFNDTAYKPQNTQVIIKMSNLLHYINNVKHGDYRLTDKDIQRLPSYNPNSIPTQPKEKEYIFNINGVNWVLTPDKKHLSKKNNPNAIISVEDAFKMLSDKDAEALINML